MGFIERAVILSHGDELQIPLGELRGRLQLPAAIPATAFSDGVATLEHAEREHIIRALREAEWIVGGPKGAAMRLGMKRTTLQSRIKKLGIARPN